MFTDSPIRFPGAIGCALTLMAVLTIRAGGGAGLDPQLKAHVKAVHGKVEWLPVGTERWIPLAASTELRQGDQVRTGWRSRAVLESASNGATLTLDEGSRIEFQHRPSGLLLRILEKGRLFHFLRGRPGSVSLEAGNTRAAVEGTEFAFTLRSDGSVSVKLFDGRVRLSTPMGEMPLNSGDIAAIAPNEPPVRQTAVLQFGDPSQIQWALYYPAILNVDELGWMPNADSGLRPSYDAYRRGHLPEALAAYPEGRHPESDAEGIFLAALVLSAGQVDAARDLLGHIRGNDPALNSLADAHHRLIAAVLRQDGPPRGPPEPEFSTSLLAASYEAQSTGDLDAARDLARRATELAPAFGFAWARRAEIEFGFGQLRPAARMARRALECAPQNAQAFVLMGFLAAAAHRTDEAEHWFDRAIGVDGALGNAWLGRGLIHIRRGNLEQGRRDLQVASALEPQRSFLRTYLARAFADGRPWVLARETARARHELSLARALDRNDPIPWLFESHLLREANRIPEAIRALDNAHDRWSLRSLYRSRVLINQDRSVAGANLARAFQDAGMADLALVTAGRSVSADYANPASHKFLADSYARGPSGLRYETPRLSEYLTANLLAPVGSGLFSYALSQQEYSTLFEQDGPGVFSQTTYLSRGAWSQYGGVHETHRTSHLLAEAFHISDPGYAPNNDITQFGFSLQIKQQLGLRDSLYGQVIYSSLDAGDISISYDPESVNPRLRVAEQVWPGTVAGWHRAWSPEHHSILLAGWIESQLDGSAIDIPEVAFDAVRSYHSQAHVFTSEAQHIWTHDAHTLVAGTRLQMGGFDVRYVDETPAIIIRDASAQPDFNRFQVYGYETWRPTEGLHLTAGFSYDDVQFPMNHAYPPVADAEVRRSRLSPKAGLMWEIIPRTWLRAAYSQSLGGVSIDQSYRLEPTLIAGFNQAFRSLTPESVAETGPVPEFETFGLALDSRLATNTWLTLSLEQLAAESSFWQGTGRVGRETQTLRKREFREQSIQATVNQLLDETWSLGLRYRLSRSELDRSEALANPSDDALLHSVSLSVNFNHHCGLFAAGEAVWLHQADATMYDDSSGLSLGIPAEDLWQLNLWAGWRFINRRAEILVGILNLTDTDYRIHPIALVSPPERERTFVARLSFNF